MTRHRRTDDERSVSVRLTDAGRALHDPAFAVNTAMIDALDLDEEQFAELRDQLRIVTERVTQPRAEARADART